MFKVYAGTHIGISGLYGEKYFDTDNPREIARRVSERNPDIKMKQFHKSYYWTAMGDPVHCFVNEKGETLFEFMVIYQFQSRGLH